jgi:CxxC-x17-CxxC domain-containing protein
MAFKKEAKKFGRDSPGRSFGGGRRPPASFGRDRPSVGRGGYTKKPFETFEAECENCGVTCDLPFKPTNGKPVYCRDCFKKNNDRDGRDDDFAPKKSSYSSSASKGPSADDLKAIHEKLDKIMEALGIDEDD